MWFCSWLTFLEATEIKQRIDRFKAEKLGSKRKDFVETVRAEQAKEGDVVAEEVPGADPNVDPMDTTEG